MEFVISSQVSLLAQGSFTVDSAVDDVKSLVNQRGGSLLASADKFGLLICALHDKVYCIKTLGLEKRYDGGKETQSVAHFERTIQFGEVIYHLALSTCETYIAIITAKSCQVHDFASFAHGQVDSPLQCISIDSTRDNLTFVWSKLAPMLALLHGNTLHIIHATNGTQASKSMSNITAMDWSPISDQLCLANDSSLLLLDSALNQSVKYADILDAVTEKAGRQVY